MKAINKPVNLKLLTMSLDRLEGVVELRVKALERPVLKLIPICDCRKDIVPKQGAFVNLSSTRARFGNKPPPGSVIGAPPSITPTGASPGAGTVQRRRRTEAVGTAGGGGGSCRRR